MRWIASSAIGDAWARWTSTNLRRKKVVEAGHSRQHA
jgi:hypothetical protein